ncbi:flagellar export protein FliJ [Epulopiscium sp. SCG-B10WGA-EpuloA2]|nr:flagellar export protein FliJ [Epulopiscium sp. SCG-B10WGA-EpuloA2]
MKFRLESILSLKKNIEQMKQKELADAYFEKQKLVNEKNQLENNKEILNKNTRQSLKGKVNPKDLIQNSQYVGVLDIQIKNTNTEIVKADNNILVKQKNLVEAMKERKILENLKEIHLEEFRKEQLFEEQKLADEVVGYRYIQRERGEDKSG